MRTPRRPQQWIAPTAAVLTAGALSVLPILTGCAETASAADAQLERFTSCAELTRYAQEKAIETLSSPSIYATTELAQEGVAAAPAARASGADAQPGGTGGGASFSRTNVQEAGIDEPDIVKTDGSRILAIAKGKLYAVDASGTAPRVVGSLRLPANTTPRDMLLSGNRLLLMADGPVAVREPLPTPAAGDAETGTTEPASSPAIAPEPGRSAITAPGGSVLIDVDVTNSATMRIVETLETEAFYLSARLTGTTARVVLNSGAPFGVAYSYPNTESEIAPTQAANRNALRRTAADNWIPRYSHRAADGRVSSGALAPCEAVSRPAKFSGLGTVTVLTIDLTQGVRPVDTDAVMASGENVYASGSALYVATNRWEMMQGRMPGTTSEPTTEIHRFDTTDGAQTSYRGSGQVDGTLLNQFSMSEHEGRLRVATTTSGQFVVGGDAVVPGPGGASESLVSILEPSGDTLVLTGRVTGLGKGERIYSVRFIGNRGYVVTFRQTDPLYSLDLSDPAKPRVTGELKINGYSAYLHPIAENLLIGVGQDATSEGRVTGTQVALFDVSDPAAPKRIQQYGLPGAFSEAEWDHHAFLWWPNTSLAVLPVQVTTQGAPTATGEIPYQVTSSALGLRVTPDGITEAGRVDQPVDPNAGLGIRRSLIVGDTLYTLSDNGLKASGLNDLAERAWLPFP